MNDKEFEYLGTSNLDKSPEREMSLSKYGIWRNSLPKGLLKLYSNMPNTFSEDAFAAAFIPMNKEITKLRNILKSEALLNTSIGEDRFKLQAEIKELKNELENYKEFYD